MSPDVSRRKFLAASAVGVGLASTAGAAAAAPGEKTTMPLRPLGKTGELISIIGFGGGSRYLLVEDEAEAEKMIHRAIALGINYFDTAYQYGSNRESQKRYGKYLTPTYRKQIMLISKIQARDAETAKRQLDETMTNLKTDQLDILFFHAVGKTEDIDRIRAQDGAYEVFQKAKEEGVTRYIGVTGHNNGAVLVDALKRIQPDAIMCPQNGARENGFTNEVVPYALAHGIGMMGMKVTAQQSLIKNGVTAVDLVRYSLSLPVAAMIVGMRSMAVLESCAEIARTLTPMSESEQRGINGKLASAAMDGTLPYLAAGYVDGDCTA